MMKKLILSIMVLILALPAIAQLNGNGYYRVQNFKTLRYAYLTDNTGKVDQGATTFDVGAILLFAGFEKAASDPATIIYVNNVTGKQYALEAQGASTTDFVEVALYIEPVPKGHNTYMCYGIKGGMRKYLSDRRLGTEGQGEASVDGTGEEREWYFHSVGVQDDNYFGIKPSITSGGKYYYPLYADFPMTPESEGVRFMTIDRVEGQYAILKEITGTLPKATPVIVECSHPLSIDNKIKVGGTGNSVGANALGGVYFDNTLVTHYNRTPYNKNTMRLLGTDSDGKLAFVTGSIEFLPANQSYLNVPSGSPETIQIVTEEEYEILRYKPTSIQLSHTSSNKNVGQTFQLDVYLRPTDAQTVLTYTSSNPAVATIDNTGLVNCLSEGTTVLTVTTDNGLNASANLTVYPVPNAVVISDTTLEMTQGETYTLSATVLPENVQDKTIRWISYNTELATVDESGTVTALKPGTVRVVARSWNSMQAECDITIKAKVIPVTDITLSQSTMTLTEGESATLNATVSPDNATDKTVTWSSSNTNIVTVDAEGKVNAITPGNAVITATSGDVSATCNVTVEKAYVPVTGISLNITNITLKIGENANLRATVSPADATEPAVTWSSDNAGVATVNESGYVTAVGEGIASIMAQAGDYSTSCTVTVIRQEDPTIWPTGVAVTPTQASIYRGETVQLNATVSPANAEDKSVTWSSSNETVATVNSEGLVSGIGQGTATITATTVNGLHTEVEINVDIRLEGIEVTPGEWSAVEGTEFDLTVTPVPADAILPTITWSSSDSSIVSVNGDGHCSILGEGVAVITAQAGGFESHCTVTGLSGIAQLLEGATSVGVYTLDGVRLMEKATAADLEKLPAGLYLINGQKVIKK